MDGDGVVNRRDGLRCGWTRVSPVLVVGTSLLHRRREGWRGSTLVVLEVFVVVVVGVGRGEGSLIQRLDGLDVRLRLPVPRSIVMAAIVAVEILHLPVVVLVVDLVAVGDVARVVASRVLGLGRLPAERLPTTRDVALVRTSTGVDSTMPAIHRQ